MAAFRCREAVTIVLALLAGGLPARAAPDSQDSGMRAMQADTVAADALCRRVAQADPPASDRPTAAQRKSLSGCDGEALLYGIGRPADPKQARLCAFVQRDAAGSDPGPSGLFDGAGLLMTIYANGMGVPRNRDVAAHLACTGVASAEAEREGRVPHLLGLVHSKYYGARFSPCDDITSGEEEGRCQEHYSRIAAVARSASIDNFARRLSGPAAARFVVLRKAQAAWADARSENEIDLSGSGEAAMAMAEADTQSDDFAAMLARLQKGAPPRLGAAQLAAAQRRMDAALRTLLAMKPDDTGPMGTVTADGIRTAQRAWLAYRDAWVAFAAAAYPAWDPDGAAAWVTMKRADMLTHMLPG